MKHYYITIMKAKNNDLNKTYNEYTHRKSIIESEYEIDTIIDDSCDESYSYWGLATAISRKLRIGDIVSIKEYGDDDSQLYFFVDMLGFTVLNKDFIKVY